MTGCLNDYHANLCKYANGANWAAGEWAERREEREKIVEK